MENPFLSIVIPAHNESQRLPTSLARINSFLSQQPFTAEVIVVENGSTDDTAGVVRKFMHQYPFLHLIDEKTRGKGLAVKAGMTAAKGSYRFIADADLSMPIDEILKFLPPLLPDCQIAIASRELPGSRRYGEPIYRHLVGRAFNALVRLLTLPGLRDTQCGFKCFRGDIADLIFPLQTVTGMSFDAEVLVIARRHGFNIQEVPINWYFNPDSRVRLFRDSLRMAMDLLTIRRNTRLGLYDPRKIQSV